MRPRRHGGGAGPGRHVVRLAVRQRQRGVWLLRPRSRRVRPRGEGCHRCGTPIRRAPFDGRSSHFCPRCQPARRQRVA
ncbi:zinc finger domain-containing protein [Tessaracoccus coleopterorum]|uniref:zinc finger domain-containing protein n=1 Tax=Tessaracoccus coleopterorum TaxID=2714950 RepID=UPI002F910568